MAEVGEKCEFPRGCIVAPRFYVMGAYAGDWAVYVCDEHRQWAHDAFAPWIEYPVAPPGAGPAKAVG